jgi:hypothetical protein
MALDIRLFLELLERKGAISSTTIQSELHVSQPTVSRLVASADINVLRIGRGKSALYALPRSVLGFDGRIPVYAVNENGSPQHLLNLHGLRGGQCFIETDDESLWLKGEKGNNIFDDLPYFLQDLRPQGFLGRKVATHYAKIYGYPEDLSVWNEKQLGTYLLQEGSNLPGNLIFGDHALEVFQRRQLTTIEDRKSTYPELAKKILNEWQEGSSTGGEHQKFVCHTKDKGHVIVKFSPAGNSDEAIRWQDLLICEHHALESMSNAGMNAASTSVYKFKGRVFFESQRFDRNGNTGRTPMISLFSIENEFTAEGNNWANVSKKLLEQKLITSDDQNICMWNDLYGQWIGNTDRHLGNISMTVTEKGFKLLPAYDMLPMIYAPERGEIVKRTYNMPVKPMAKNVELWETSAHTACDFWAAVKEDQMISDSFRQLALDNLAKIKKIIKEST